MVRKTSFKRLILRVVLRQVSPMVIRLVSVSDQMQLPDFHDLFRTILGWRGDLGYSIRVHSQEFNSFRRKTQSKALHELKLHRQEKFLYICDTLNPRKSSYGVAGAAWSDRDLASRPARASSFVSLLVARLFPDGKSLAMQVSDGSNADIWVYDQQRDATTKLTFGGGIYSAPV